MNFEKIAVESLKLLSSLDQVDPGNDNFNSLLHQHIDIMESKSMLLPNVPKDLEWLNVSEPLQYDQYLHGKVLLLDFFTYCCINCMHILPGLHVLEQTFPVQSGLAVLGIHSAKFPNEKLTSNILNAVIRYNITHPILNDPDAYLWNAMNIQCWPTFVFVSPTGNVILYLVGESHTHLLPDLTKTFLEHYKAKDQIKDHDLPLALAKDSICKQSLLFPGKICIMKDKLAISDTGNHRIIIAHSSGIVDEIVGNGEGDEDGSFSKAKFSLQQGVCFSEDIIFVADTENHKVKEINLKNKTVKTLTGTGIQGLDMEGGNKGEEQVISSPWDVVIAEAPGSIDSVESKVLYIAMAGTHQVWSYFLNDGPWIKKATQQATTCLRFSGSGKEENRNNSYPHKASFAQPSGLTSGEVKDQKVLFVADSESSSIRIIDLKTGGVKACVGGDRDPMNLFAFGDQDGKGVTAKLQHPLAVTWESKSKQLFVADSYNHKIKVIDPSCGECKTLSGSGKGGFKDGAFEDALFNEPGGICCSADGRNIFVADTNNHAIRILNLESKTVSTLQILISDHLDRKLTLASNADRLGETIVSRNTPVHIFASRQVPNRSQLKINCNVSLPSGCHFTEDAPSKWRIFTKDQPADSLTTCFIPRNGTLSDKNTTICSVLKRNTTSQKFCTIQVEIVVFFCKTTSSICLMKSVVLEQELLFVDSELEDTLSLDYTFELP